MAYKAPERAGVSYMRSPILRTYVNPEENDTAITNNVPHVMHYVPNAGNDAVGGAAPAPDELRYMTEHGHWRNTPDPFVILQGPHGYMVQFLGATERSTINKEYEEMLARLCKIKDVGCLPKQESQCRTCLERRPTMTKHKTETHDEWLKNRPPV